MSSERVQCGGQIYGNKFRRKLVMISKTMLWVDFHRYESNFFLIFFNHLSSNEFLKKFNKSTISFVIKYALCMCVYLIFIFLIFCLWNQLIVTIRHGI